MQKSQPYLSSSNPIFYCDLQLAKERFLKLLSGKTVSSYLVEALQIYYETSLVAKHQMRPSSLSTPPLAIASPHHPLPFTTNSQPSLSPHTSLFISEIEN